MRDEFFSKVNDSNHKNFFGAAGTSTSTSLYRFPFDLKTYGQGFLQISHSNYFQVYEITLASSFLTIFQINQYFKHSKCVYLTDPSHLHELSNGFSGLYSFPQQILQVISSELLTTPQSISTASSSWKSSSSSAYSGIFTGDTSLASTLSAKACYVSVLKSLTLNLSLPNLITSFLFNLYSCTLRLADFKFLTTTNILLL